MNDEVEWLNPCKLPQGARPTHVRYVVLGLTVAAYMITYMDRQILATTRPVIMEELGISLVAMGWITFAFRMAYALFQIPGGWLGDTHRRAPRADAGRELVERLHRAHRAGLERRFDDRDSGFLRRGRSRSVSHRHAVAFALDAADRTRLRAGRHARRVAPGRGAHAS